MLLQRDLDQTPTCVEEEIRTKPPVATLQEDVMANHQEGDIANAETMMQGPPAEPENGEPIHLTAPPVKINNDERPEPNFLDTLDDE